LTFWVLIRELVANMLEYYCFWSLFKDCYSKSPKKLAADVIKYMQQQMFHILTCVKQYYLLKHFKSSCVSTRSRIRLQLFTHHKRKLLSGLIVL